MDDATWQRTADQLEPESAADVVRWAQDRFGGDLVLTASFQDCVLIDVATQVAPGIRVVFLDTGFHFPETLEFVELVRRRYDLNLTIVRPDLAADEWPCGSDRCCAYRKVLPLQTVLDGAQAWMTGLRRAETAARAATPVVAFDASRDVVKVNPLATWTDADVADHSATHQLPEHPLVAHGYRSIGCAPTTLPVSAGADARSGRWAGTDRTECGLHLAFESR